MEGQNSERKKRVLILGGSVFMGLSTLRKLAGHTEYEVHYINRGRNHWNNEVRNIENTHFSWGNRRDREDITKLLQYLSKKLGMSETNKWEAVIDFSAFKYHDIRSVYDALKGKTKLYLFISSDSVYDVCDREVRKQSAIVEEYAVRPKDEKLREQYKADEEYGHDKLKCEEYLYKVADRTQFPFIIFRLPDVIGPFDDTSRYWSYLIWIRNSMLKPVELDEESYTRKLSFVYSEDVSDMIVKIVTQVEEKWVLDALNNSYHLAFAEAPTVYEFMERMARTLFVECNYRKMVSSKRIFYPSVHCGNLSIAKAKQILNWEPKPMEDAMEQTTAFFINAEDKNLYPPEEKAAVAKFKTGS